MKMMFRSAALAALLLVVACASLGLAPATSFSDRLSYAYGTNAGARTAAANSLRAGTLSSEDADYVLKTTDSTRTFLDAAKAAAGAGDTKTAEGRLSLALNVLDQVQTYLNRKVKP